MAVDTSLVHIDFEFIRTNSCKSIKILDTSNWANAENDPSYVEITTPGRTQSVTHVFQKGRINIFNVVNLNLSDVVDYSSLTPLPDGMYKVTVLQCQDDPLAKTQYYLQDCQLRCNIARKLISVDLTCSPCRVSLLRELQEVMLFLEGAQAQTSKCNVNKAMEYYQRASTLLNRISDKNEKCNC
jgi:hypothetical protein